MAKRVYVLTRDLLFRSKLRGTVAALGGEITRDASVGDLAVVELEADAWEQALQQLTGRGVPTLAFGAHVNAELLRRARELGAEAVPNSQVERRLTELLGT